MRLPTFTGSSKIAKRCKAANRVKPVMRVAGPKSRTMRVRAGYLVCLAALVFGGSGADGDRRLFQEQASSGLHAGLDTPSADGSTRDLSDQASSEADEIPSVVQPFVIDWTAARRVGSSFNAKDRAPLLDF
jgi:hypothetical protein